MLAPLLELTFAQRIRRIYKVQFMLCIGTLKQVTEPGSLRPSIAGKVKYDRDALRQESTNVWSERVLQSGRVIDELPYVSDLAREEPIQEFVLDK
jgi:hypothetical protein